tara:strand:+ start:465 stop:644 length:180 start_codon:yes stop_codon:yes gene_type:complete
VALALCPYLFVVVEEPSFDAYNYLVALDVALVALSYHDQMFLYQDPLICQEVFVLQQPY